MRKAIFLFRPQLRQRLSRGLGGEEQRIVSEAVGPARRQRDASVHAPLGPQDAPALGRAERDRAEEMRPSARHRDALERREQLRAPLGVGRRVTRAVHAGRALQRIDAEPAVVRERPEPAVPRADGGLLRGVVVKGVPRLLRNGHAGVAQGDQLEGHAGEDLPDLDQLPLVRSGDQQLHFTKAPAMAASCFWCSSARPFCAIPTMALSCAGVNGRFSAVPCTSSSSPAAFPTTFMSTSAAQSISTCRSPSTCRSTAARSDRPISRWISWVRPLCFPLAASRSVRVCVERGSIPYSAVTHPRPDPFTCPGTRSSAVAVQRTRVRPKLASTLPSACSVKLATSVTLRSWSGPRSFRGMGGATYRVPSGEATTPADLTCGDCAFSGGGLTCATSRRDRTFSAKSRTPSASACATRRW